MFQLRAIEPFDKTSKVGKLFLKSGGFNQVMCHGHGESGPKLC